MKLQKKLDEKTHRFKELERDIGNWMDYYNSGVISKDYPELNSNVYKLKKIKSIISEMLEVAENIETLKEVIKESETL